jgi:F-type H+/Na+-transporting ATPase subunit alpha
LDRATRAQLERGLRIQEILKQPQYRPMPLAQQVMILWAVTNGALDEVPIERIRPWEDGFHAFMANNRPEIAEAITRDKQMNEETLANLRSAIDDYKKTIPA